MTGTLPGIEALLDTPLAIANRSFRSRLMVGTGKYRSNAEMVRAIEASGAEIVTVAVRRVDLDRTKDEGILYHLNPEQFFLLAVARRLFSAGVPTSAYLILALAVLGVVSVWLMRKQQSDELGYVRNSMIMGCVFTVLVAPHFSWYFAWLVVFLCFVPSVAVFYLTLSSFLLYLTWLGDDPNRVLMLKALIFVPFFILGLLRK